MSISIEPTDGAFARKELLSVPEAVLFTGLSASTLWRYIERGRLAKVQHGGPRSRVLLRRTDLLAIASPPENAGSIPLHTGTVTRTAKLSGRKPAWKTASLHS